MSECHDDLMRDALPLLRLGQLEASEAARVRAHVADCAACRDELALLERSARLFEAATPRVDVAAIVAALPAPARPALRVMPGGSGRRRVPQYAVAAAASLVLVASLSLAALKGRFFGPPSGGEITPDTAVPAVASVPVGLLGGTELADLGASDLEALLSELEALEATVAAEPVSMQRAVVQAPEGL